ncbi:hypothetical protein GOP47_0020893 [Adiantum capillus-veneris]|uniref:Uncharacterized protein n=1 Tax=Adiantum capillus-veneris TaxID=13818 RepID=A0A9D4Z6I8_ADICA|nr:hypothetical protein GOP47_0020893 [Adiantum capillus-veneris]
MQPPIIAYRICRLTTGITTNLQQQEQGTPISYGQVKLQFNHGDRSGRGFSHASSSSSNCFSLSRGSPLFIPPHHQLQQVLPLHQVYSVRTCITSSNKSFLSSRNLHLHAKVSTSMDPINH